MCALPLDLNFHSLTNTNSWKDSLIAKRSGLARVTAVARSNYDAVNREQLTLMCERWTNL